MSLYRNLFTVLMALVISSCGVTKERIQNYEGEVLETNQVALVKPTLLIIIESINGDTSKSITPWQDFGSIDAEIAFIPGVHDFELKYRDLHYASDEPAQLKANLKANRKYLIEPKLSLVEMKWQPVITDVTNEPERWCLLGKDCVSN